MRYLTPRMSGHRSDSLLVQSPFFYGEDEAAADWNMSPGGLRQARQRGELEGAYVVCGRRVLYSRLAPRLAALGLNEPARLAAFCRELGIGSLDKLLSFLGMDRGEP